MIAALPAAKTTYRMAADASPARTAFARGLSRQRSPRAQLTPSMQDVERKVAAMK